MDLFTAARDAVLSFDRVTLSLRDKAQMKKKTAKRKGYFEVSEFI